MRIAAAAAAVLLLATAASLEAQPRRRAAPRAPAAPYKTTLTPDEMRNRQAVLETTSGTIVFELLPDLAPNHVGYFIEQARAGTYDGTTFHRAIRLGIIQGGDPISKDPAKRDQYGTGGLGVLAAEFSDTPIARGTVAAVLQPGRPDSAGTQFFIAITDQPALTGQYTVFARVVEGLEIAQKISEAPVDANGRVEERIEITSVTIREAPPPEPEPFSTETAAELANWRAVLETDRGAITIAFMPDKAPEHVRNFLRLASAGVYDGTSVHRVVRGFVVQTGMISTRKTPLTQKQQALVRNLQPEFNDTRHELGVVSMARLDAPASASTSFFICTGPAPSLDGKYTAFGRVVDGLDVVRALDGVEVNGDAPVERIELVRVRLEKQ
ncbi:MAG TPA: peptidylprolyl isomerase [Vicinamibacterales bacterium]